MSDSVDLHAVVVGGGAIAQALLDRLSSDSAMTRITLLARGIETEPSDRVACKRLELLDESSIVSAAEFAGNRGPIDTLIVATGLLHDQCGLRPEKRLSESNEAHAAAVIQRECARSGIDRQTHAAIDAQKQEKHVRRIVSTRRQHRG